MNLFLSRFTGLRNTSFLGHARPFMFPRRYAHSLVAHNIGHIKLDPNEGLFFVDNLVNTPTYFYIQRYTALLFQNNLKKQLSAAFPSSDTMQLEDIIFRWQDGGAFLKVRYKEFPQDTEAVSEHVRESFRKRPVRTILHPFSTPIPHMVHGIPWLQDLYIFPSRTVDVNFEGPPLSQERLYSIFRTYGKLRSVTVNSPTSATLSFSSLRSATSALNCMHGFVYGKTEFHMRYRHMNRFVAFKDWLFSHPRFTIPLVAAAITVLTASLFDPIRKFFVETNIVHGQKLRNINVVGWVKKKTRDIVLSPFHENGTNIKAPIWTTREKDCEQLKEWLDEALHSFIVVQGPRGSGKRDLVDRVVKERKNVLFFDCDRLFSTTNTEMFVSTLASQTGYFPLFSFLNNISSLIDMAAQGLIGQKTGIVSSSEGQVRQILNTTQTVLRSLALREHKEADTSVLDESEFLEVHADRLPVVILDNFQLRKLSNPMQRVVAEWAGNLVKEGIAHVLMLTPDVGGTKSLEQYVNGWENRTLLLGDADPVLAQRYVIESLPEEMQTEELRKELRVQLPKIGGRLRDLDYVARRLRVNSSSVSEAIGGIVSQNASDILQTFLRPASLTSEEKPTFTPEESWTLITYLSQHEYIPYHMLMLDPLFKGHDDAVRALEESELITITTVNARPDKVYAGKPVYVTAFRQLVNDPVLSANMQLVRCNALIGMANNAIKNDEQELQMLKDLGNLESGVKDRGHYLTTRIQKNQGVITDNEKSIERLTEALKKID